jgi:hypothetical protein
MLKMSDKQSEETQETAQSKIKLMPKNISVNAQNRHIIGTDGYNQYVISQKNKGEYGPSIIYGGIWEAQALVDKYAGTGIANIKKGIWTRTEDIETDSVIGVVVNNLNGVEQLTANFKIHYADDGTHIVPDYDISRRGMKP